ncbi:hypothetical protein [Prauserella halophila]|uniref:hypothetical protein n=1 Tax=Prauserella halophila TaxID=185641 RepID=UPI0020A2CD3E|nr:hypothetical protein [Prauserella halophila]
MTGRVAVDGEGAAEHGPQLRALPGRFLFPDAGPSSARAPPVASRPFRKRSGSSAPPDSPVESESPALDVGTAGPPDSMISSSS